MDDVLAQALSDSGTPGIAVGAIIAGKVVYLKGQGVRRSSDSGSAIDCHTRFHVASLSKPVVATALLTALERGEMRETDTLADLISGARANAEIIELMTHTAGMRNWLRANGRHTAESKAEYFQQVLKRAERLDGSHRFHYSDTNYNLLALTIEQRFGTTLQNFVRERVFDPVGMTESGFDLKPRDLPSSAWPHVGKRNTPRDMHPFDVAFAGSSGLQSSAHDMVLFMQAYIEQVPSVMNTDSYQKAIEPRLETEWAGVSQSLVWQVATRAGRRALQHGGSDKGFRALVTIYPESRAGIVILANGENLDRWALRAKIEGIILAR